MTDIKELTVHEIRHDNRWKDVRCGEHKIGSIYMGTQGDQFLTYFNFTPSDVPDRTVKDCDSLEHSLSWLTEVLKEFISSFRENDQMELL